MTPFTPFTNCQSSIQNFFHLINFLNQIASKKFFFLPAHDLGSDLTERDFYSFSKIIKSHS